MREDFRKKLTRGERFKDARVSHNQYGKQSMDAVSEATGITKSVIHALENDAEDKERNVGYMTVAKLAKHYGVSADYLLGLSDDYQTKPSAVDELGLSVEAVTKLQEWSKDHQEYIAVASCLLASYDFEDFLSHAYHYDLVANAASCDEYTVIRSIVEKHQAEAMDYLGTQDATPLITAFVALKSNLDHKAIANFYLHEAQEAVTHAITHMHDSTK